MKKYFSGHLNVSNRMSNQTLPCPGNISPGQVVCNMYTCNVSFEQIMSLVSRPCRKMIAYWKTRISMDVVDIHCVPKNVHILFFQ